MPIQLTWLRNKSHRDMSAALVAGAGRETSERRWRLTSLSRALSSLYRERAAPVSVRYKMGFKTSDVPLAERSTACVLLLELESLGLVIEVAGKGWVASETAEAAFQEYTDSDWLDHRSENGRA